MKNIINFLISIVLLIIALAIIGSIRDCIIKYREKRKTSTIDKYVRIYSKRLKEKYTKISKQEILISPKESIGYIIIYNNKGILTADLITNSYYDFYKDIIESFLDNKYFLLEESFYEENFRTDNLYIYKQKYILNDLFSILSEIKDKKENSTNKDFIYVLQVLNNFFDETSGFYKNKELLSEAFEYSDEFLTDKLEVNFVKGYKEMLNEYLMNS